MPTSETQANIISQEKAVRIYKHVFVSFELQHKWFY